MFPREFREGVFSRSYPILAYLVACVRSTITSPLRRVYHLQSHILVTRRLVCVGSSSLLLFLATCRLCTGAQFSNSFYNPGDKAPTFRQFHGSNTSQTHHTVYAAF